MRLADGGYPPVTGLKARIGGRELFVPVGQDRDLEPGAVRLSGEKLSLGRFERRAGRGAARRATCSAASSSTSRPIRRGWSPRTRSSSRASTAGGGSSASIRARARSCAGRCRAGCAGWSRDRPFLDWADMEPFVGHVPSSRLRFSHRKLANLHPAEIADLVEAASHEEGEEMIEAVAQDRELEADVFEELDEHHQLEFIRERPDTQVGGGDRAHGGRRRCRPDRRDRPGAPGARYSRCCRRPAAPDRSAARLQPLDGRRPDEPRLHQRSRRRTRSRERSRRCARATSRGHAHDRLPAATPRAG